VKTADEYGERSCDETVALLDNPSEPEFAIVLRCNAVYHTPYADCQAEHYDPDFRLAWRSASGSL
jgi:hypothetical protein